MITLDALIVTIEGLDSAEVERWIADDWLRPERAQGTWRFAEIDVARLHLIRDLRHDLGLSDEALPVILRLLDQLYDERRRLRLLKEAVERTATQEVRDAVLAALRTIGASADRP